MRVRSTSLRFELEKVGVLFPFTPGQQERFFRAAEEDLRIASETTYNQARFRFSYDAMLKLEIALIARQGYKVRSFFSHCGLDPASPGRQIRKASRKHA